MVEHHPIEVGQLYRSKTSKSDRIVRVTDVGARNTVYEEVVYWRKIKGSGPREGAAYLNGWLDRYELAIDVRVIVQVTEGDRVTGAYDLTGKSADYAQGFAEALEEVNPRAVATIKRG